MASAKYSIKGNLSTALAGATLEDLTVVAYRFLGTSSMQKFGSCSVAASGDFKLEFEGPPGPVDVHIMPIPIVIETFGVFNVERSVPGLLFPRTHIAAGDWVLSGGVYTKSVRINIPDHIWGRWEWLSEEFTVVGQAVKQVDEAYLPLPFAWVSAADADVPLAYGSGVGSAQADEGGNFTITFRRVNFFLDYANYSPPLERYGVESWPDLIFHMTQVIGGVKTSIYSETEHDARPQSEWNVPHRMLYVTLVAEEGITHDEDYVPLPPGDNFLFHGIGVVDPHSIEKGYATTGPGDDLPNRRNCPFGSWLHVKGQFDTAISNPPKYYQVLYAQWSGSTSPDLSEFQPILNESWTVSKFDASTGDWRPLVVEPISGVIAGEAGEKVYEIPDYLDITLTKKTRLVRWMTHRKDTGVRRYPDGKYDLLIKAWDASGKPVDLNPSHPEDNRLTVVIDNTWPKALLEMIGPHDILRTDEMYPYTPVCPVFSKTDPALGGSLDVTFDATDENDHFLQYRLSFITGHNFYVDQFIKRYDGDSGSDEVFKRTRKHTEKGTGTVTTTHPLPDDIRPPGGFSNEVVNWDISSPDVVECAYQVRLDVWDRAINGYGYIHHAQDTMHFSLEP